MSTAARHPRARVTVQAARRRSRRRSPPALARADEDADQIEARLKTASNQQLLRLQRAATRLKDKWGSREKLIAAIGAAQNKGKDKDFLAKLDRYSLPQLLDLATRERASRPHLGHDQDARCASGPGSARSA